MEAVENELDSMEKSRKKTHSSMQGKQCRNWHQCCGTMAPLHGVRYALDNNGILDVLSFFVFSFALHLK